MRFLFDTLRPWDVEDLTADISGYVNIEKQEQLEQLKDVLSQYMCIVQCNKHSVPFQVAINNGNGDLKNPDAFSRLVGVIVINFTCDFLKHHPNLKVFWKGSTEGRKIKKRKEIEPVKLSSIVNAGALPVMLKTMYEKISYIPDGMIRKHTGDPILSKWIPSKYFLYSTRTTHASVYCGNCGWFMSYYPILKERLLDPWNLDLKLNPGLQVLKDIFVLFKAMAENNEEYALYLLRWTAWVVYSGMKSQTSILFYGDAGIGKSTLLLILKKLIAAPDGKNYCNIPSAQLFNRFTSEDEVCSQLVAYEEYEAAKFDKTICAKLKNKITCDSYLFESKQVNARTEENFSSYIFTTNNLPIGLVETNDRRFVLFSSSTVLKKEHLEKNHIDSVLARIYEYMNDPLPLQKGVSLYCNLKNFDHHCPRCFQKRTNNVDEGIFYLLSYYFLLLFLDGCSRKWKPFDPINMPKTELLHNMKYADCEFSKFFLMLKMKKSNCSYPNNFVCPICVAGPFKKIKTSEEHFDPDVPEWQTCCVDLWKIYCDNTSGKVTKEPTLDFIEKAKFFDVVKVRGPKGSFFFNFPPTYEAFAKKFV